MQLIDVINKGSHQQLSEVLRANAFQQKDLWLALAEATRQGKASIAEILLKHGADPSHLPPDHWSILHIAVEFEQIELIQLFIKNGLDVNFRDQKGWTPLHLAVDLEGDGAWQTDSEPTIYLTKLLLDLGANPFLKNKEGETAYQIAEFYGHQKALDLFDRWKKLPTK
ncbi:Hypothetical protein PBC10988_21750 [Planctomycetales bacterium 10988]|nr:Hypothetical protein PBC10988_21750 [Planctomycetales bacterium 10988]